MHAIGQAVPRQCQANDNPANRVVSRIYLSGGGSEQFCRYGLNDANKNGQRGGDINFYL